MDRILTNGSIYTMDKKLGRVQALGIKDGKIMLVGSNREVLDQKTENTEVIDLIGKTVVPGFNDSHLHLLSYGLSKRTVDLNQSKSIREVIGKTKNYIHDHQLSQEKWVEGRGWDQNLFIEGRMLNRDDLDQISKKYPIMLKRTCGQVTTVNSIALSIIFGDREKQDLLASKGIEKEEDGTLTGNFRGNAQEIVYDVIPQLTVEEIKEGITGALKDYVSAGLTSVQTNDFELKKADYQDVLQAYEELDQAGLLPVKVNLMVCLPQKEDLKNFISKGYQTGKGSSFFRIGPFTLQTDGSLGARTAALSEEYTDEPGQYGVLYYEKGDFLDIMEFAWKNGLQLAADGIGDQGIDLALETFHHLQKNYPKDDPRSCVDHCQITTEELIRKFAEYKVMGGLEVVFVSSDLHMVEERIGTRRAKSTYNWKEFFNKKIPVAFGSDSPVESFNPLLGIYAAVTRKDYNGYPEKGWLSEQKLSVEEALYGYTVGPSYATFEEDEKGRLIQGQSADLTVLSEDIFTVVSKKIKDISVEWTMVDGVVRFEKEEE